MKFATLGLKHRAPLSSISNVIKSPDGFSVIRRCSKKTVEIQNLLSPDILNIFKIELPIPKEAVLGPILFNIFINDLEDIVVRMLIKSMAKTLLGGSWRKRIKHSSVLIN